MEDLKIEEENTIDEYVPEDPNAPVDDFEISEIEIENYMPEELKNAIKRYNEIHRHTIEDLMKSNEEDDEINDDSMEDSDIIEDRNSNLDLKNIF